ncbi:MAG: methionine synthase [Nocardioidaceae bacterium]|nr:methionine synthase [Nocardioidaceae bacterium]
MTNHATGLGSMPGEDIAESMRIVLGEAGAFPYVPELPARGATATMIGRTLALVTELGVDLQPAGWRLTDAPGLDHRRAASLLAQDLDTVEELSAGHDGPFKLQVAGPWTLAATVERPRGDKVLADHGARRELAQALAQGVQDHVGDVRRRTGSATIVVQVDEPALPAVLAGAVPTASGFGRHRTVTPADSAAALGWVVDAAIAAEAVPVVHCCAEGLPWAVLGETRVQAVSFDLSKISRGEYDDIAEWVDSGRQVWPGVVPVTEPERRPTDADLTKQLLAWWAHLGYSDVETLPPMTVTPACGLAGASPAWTRQALQLATAVAQNLSVEQGKIDA